MTEGRKEQKVKEDKEPEMEVDFSIGKCKSAPLGISPIVLRQRTNSSTGLKPPFNWFRSKIISDNRQ